MEGWSGHMELREATDLIRHTLLLALVVSAPMLLIGLAVGILVSLVQAVTQIQEQTLVFVPKILAIFLVLLIALPFAGEAMATYMDSVAARIAQP